MRDSGDEEMPRTGPGGGPADSRPARKSCSTRSRLLLLPRGPERPEKSVILEIRAGAGWRGKPKLFAAELLRMYLRYAERHRMNARS